MTASLSTDCLSLREIRRRLCLLDRATEHLKTGGMMPPENAYNREVTLHDIAKFVGFVYRKRDKGGHSEGAPGKSLRAMIKETAPPWCPFDCREIHICKKSPPCRNVTGALQQRLSDCLRGLDDGTTRKVRLADGWRLVQAPVTRHAALAQMAATARPAPEARSITGTIELGPGGPRLKL